MSLRIDGLTLYTTAEACRLAGTNRDTYLRWVREGKFADVAHRDRNGWRLFTTEDIERLKTRVNHIERHEMAAEG
jgi:excisionase family DNA binding protein